MAQAESMLSREVRDARRDVPTAPQHGEDKVKKQATKSYKHTLQRAFQPTDDQEVSSKKAV